MIRHRIVLGVLCFFALALGYVQRFCLSLAITEMVMEHISETEKVDPHACPMYNVQINQTFDDISHVKAYKGEFDWSEKTQGLILSSFFWGYVIGQLPGGKSAEIFGGKIVLGGTTLLGSFLTLATPFIARTGEATGLLMLRIILGLTQGPLYPSINVLLAHWIPPQERGRMGALVFAGAQIGNVISMALSGLLIYNWGWDSIFYVYGIAGIVWTIIWYFTAFSSPSLHPRINKKEMDYLKKTLVNIDEKEPRATPWMSMLKSRPLWALIIAQIGHDWGLFTIITDLPKYMKSVLHFSVRENGFLSAAPYLVMWIFALLSGWIVDWLISKKGCDITVIRKLFITIASLGPAIGILFASYAECNRRLVTSLFTIGMGLMGAFVPSLKVNPLDLAPRFAGTLMALVGGVGALSGIIAPYTVGVLVSNNTMLEWRMVFWVAVVVMCITNFIYVLFGSGNVQPWNDNQAIEENNIEVKKKNSISKI